MKSFALLLLLITLAHAAETTSLVLPSYGGSQALINFPPAIDDLYCWDFPARLGIVGATHFAAGVNAGRSDKVCTFALYNSAGTTQYAAIHDNCLVGVKTATVAAPISIAQGDILRICICSTQTTAQYTAVWEGTADGPGQDAIVNGAGTIRAGVAANHCAGGMPPPTTGSLVAQIIREIPIFLLEVP